MDDRREIGAASGARTVLAEHPGDDRWIRRYEPAARARVRLACLPHAGGAASFYLPLARALAPAVDVLAVQYPGRQDRLYEPCLPSIMQLAAGVVRALSGGPAPLALFGHSMGATLAYEVALRLEDSGIPVACLFASARPAPSLQRPGTLHLSDDAVFLAELLSLSGTDPQVAEDRELLDLLMPALRADYRAIETYPPQHGMLRCPIVALVGDRDPRASATEAQAWARHTTGPFTLHTFSGAHFYLKEHALLVAQIISANVLA